MRWRRRAPEPDRIGLVSGEAGIGKTALVRRVARAGENRARFLWGTCDPLLTPRALGPVHDIARDAGGELAHTLAGGAWREAVFAALLDELVAGDLTPARQRALDRMTREVLGTHAGIDPAPPRPPRSPRRREHDDGR